MPARVVITDIEGTTSSIAFVTEVLFPYARRHLPGFVRAHCDDRAVRALLDATAAEAALDPTDIDGIVAALVRWIDDDRKVTPLKTLQGMIWKQGYESGEIVAHVYDDAAIALERWHRAGYALYVYSSGSVLAQQLFFAHTGRGNLTGLFSGYFDTTTGAKRDADSYRRIVEEVGVPAGEVVFLSDVEEELDAAREAGVGTVWVRRAGASACAGAGAGASAGVGAGGGGGHSTVTGFGEIELG